MQQKMTRLVTCYTLLYSKIKADRDSYQRLHAESDAEKASEKKHTGYTLRISNNNKMMGD